MIPAPLVAPLVTASITGALAALIALTDRLVNNYGQLDVNVNGRKLSVKGGSPLLLTLAEQGIFVPSACGGRGSCGACKVKVLSDVGAILPTEAPYLSAEEQAGGTRLSCQIKVKNPIAIELPESLFSIRRFQGRVERIRDLTYDIKEILIGLDEPIEFTAGQYGQLEVPPYEKIKEATQRAYSISSRPADKRQLEFLVRLVPGGIVTTYVFRYLKQGEVVTVVGPFGEFGLRDTQAVMLCVAGGSGMAPFKSIFNDMIDRGRTDREIWYFFGARAARDLFYQEELDDIRRRYGEKFHYVPALSEPQPQDDWKGETGLITQVLDRYLTEVIDPTAPKEGYLCGSPGMLDACMEVMRNRGIQESSIHFDKFS